MSRGPFASGYTRVVCAATLLGRCDVADANQVRPNYGGQPRGKANIMRQGQTEVDA